jgi:hypothetical protein
VDGNGKQVGVADAEAHIHVATGLPPTRLWLACRRSWVRFQPDAAVYACAAPTCGAPCVMPAVRAAQAVTIRLAGDEASDFLNFVIKNPETNTWYDLEGTNFQIALRSPPVEAAPVPTSSPMGGAGQGEKGELPPLLPLDKIPQLPQVGAQGGSRGRSRRWQKAGGGGGGALPWCAAGLPSPTPLLGWPPSVLRGAAFEDRSGVERPAGCQGMCSRGCPGVAVLVSPRS